MAGKSLSEIQTKVSLNHTYDYLQNVIDCISWYLNRGGSGFRNEMILLGWGDKNLRILNAKALPLYQKGAYDRGC